MSNPLIIFKNWIKRNIAKFIVEKIDILQGILSSHDISTSYTDFLIKICSSALKEYIELNSFYDNDKYIIYEDINIGLYGIIPIFKRKSIDY